MKGKCWFVQSESSNTFTSNEYQCNFCEKNFNGKSEYMKNRMLEHTMNVTPCIHALTGKCIYGKENCWYIYDKQETDKTEKSFNITKMCLTNFLI